MPTTADLSIVIKARDQASRALRGVEQQTERTGRSFGRLGRGTAAASKGVSGLASSFVGMINPATLAASAVAALGAGLVANVQRYTENTKRLKLMSRATGASVRGLSRLEYAFKRAGYDAEDLSSAIAEVSIKLGDARDGVDSAVVAFQRLGLDWNALQELSPDEAFTKVAEALRGVENAAERVHIADTIFGGDDARKVLALTDDLERLTDEADRLGHTLDDSAVGAAQRFGDAVSAIGARVEGLANQLAAAAINIATPFVESFARVIGAVPAEVDLILQATLQQAASKAKNFLAVGAHLGGELVRGFRIAAELPELEGLSQGIADMVRENHGIRPTTSEASKHFGIDGANRRGVGRYTHTFPTLNIPYRPPTPRKQKPGYATQAEALAALERSRFLDEFLAGTEARQERNLGNYRVDMLRAGATKLLAERERAADSTVSGGGSGYGYAPRTQAQVGSARQRIRVLLDANDFGGLEGAVEGALSAFASGDYGGVSGRADSALRGITERREVQGRGSAQLDDLETAIKDLSQAASDLAPDAGGGGGVAPTRRSSSPSRPRSSGAGSYFSGGGGGSAAAPVRGGTTVNVYVEGYVGAEDQLVAVIRRALRSGLLRGIAS